MKKNKSVHLLVLCLSILFTLIFANGCTYKRPDAYQTNTPQITAVSSGESQTNTSTPNASDGTSEAASSQTQVQPTQAPFTFDNTLFVGDSRTDGLHEYGHIDDATFFAATSMNVFAVMEKKIPVDNMGDVYLSDVLSSQEFNKVYIMLGLNELGYNFDTLISKYTEVLSAIHTAQPNALIYVQSVLHVSAKRDASGTEENNTNINSLNARLRNLANGSYIFFMDINTVYDDANGCLAAEYTRDGCHISAAYYNPWIEWLRTSTPTP